jgi:peptide/nickel transport system permease protein
VALALLSGVIYPGDATYLPSHLQQGITCPEPIAPTWTLYPFHPGAWPLGQTGSWGFNVLQGLVLGTPWDLLLLTLVIVPSVLIGLVLGVLAGGLGGWPDDLLMGVTDIFLSVPEFLLTLIALGFLLALVPDDQRLFTFGILLVVVLWAPYARTVRSRARAVAALPFVESARAAGAGRARILARHILPASLFPVFAQIPTTLATVLLLLGGLQYANLAQHAYSCVSPATPIFLPSATFPEWTWVMANGASAWLPASSGLDPWWGYAFPALWIFLFGLGVMLVCDGLGSATGRTDRVG